ncbi:MAG: hypothetical protein HY534_01485 [Chloroflexi bacterium]|nr:hypothetical protein [Chloroflexota bacterium]
MAMAERYGSPSTQIIRLMGAWQYPFRNVEKDDKILVLTDDAMDPMVWQSAMAALYERGTDPTLAMQPRREHHCADLNWGLLAAIKEADLALGLLSTATIASPGMRALRQAGVRVGSLTLMEETTVEVLLEGGGRAKSDDVREMMELQQRIGQVYDKGTKIHLLSQTGTDLVADITSYEPGTYGNLGGRRGTAAEPFSRNPETGKLGGGTWPYGELHIEPTPNTANGTVVWDTTAIYPPGVWKNPVQLTIKDGTVTAIEGGGEADQLRWYLEKYGDENSWRVGGEMAIGTNKLAMPNLGLMRSEKKRYGAMHYGIGHGADLGLVNSCLRTEGIIGRITIVVDDNVVVAQDGKILV